MSVSNLVQQHSAKSDPTPSPTTALLVAREQYDRRVGNWRVIDHDGRGPVVARDRVTSILKGCAMLERYRQSDGLGGDGFTMYDASRGLWHQTWMTDSGTLLLLEGRFKGGTLTMRGSNIGKGSRREWYRATWRQQRMGVRETAYISVDGGKSWRLDFDLLFAKTDVGKSTREPHGYSAHARGRGR
jgi:hypothetical protein